MLETPRKPGVEELHTRAAAVRLLVFDVDGVLTDGGLFYGPTGEAFKRFDVADGHGIVMARLVGLPAAVITARRSTIIEVRGKELGLVDVVQGQKEKGPALRSLLSRQGIAPEHCAFMGDDINDLAPMALVGLPACPADAALEVRQAALFVAQRSGGHGAARELVELCLKASGRWQKAMELCGAPGGGTPSP